MSNRVNWASGTLATEQHAKAAFDRLLRRPPEDESVIPRWAGRGWSVADLANHVRFSAEFQAAAKSSLQAAFDATDRYQAVYGVPALPYRGARTCEDRCRAMEHAFRARLGLSNLAHLQVADIGCSLGYVSLYFADRGSSVVGYDLQQTSVDFCNVAARHLDIDAAFRLGTFDEALANKLIADDGVNTVFLLSVLHHVIHKLGLDEVRRLLSKLLASGITLVCELANKQEDVEYDWRGSLPEDELALFDQDVVSISEIGEFEALNGRSRRRMYLIQQTRHAVRWLPNMGSVPLAGGTGAREGVIRVRDLEFSQVGHVPVTFKQYGQNREYFCKFFRFSNRNRDSVLRRFDSEFFAARLLAGESLTPPVLGIIEAAGFYGLVFKRIRSATELRSWSMEASAGERRNVAMKVAEAIAAMGALGVYWNDCRDHNILVLPDGNVVLLDFEIAGATELEDNLRRIRFTLWHLCGTEPPEFERYSHLPTSELPGLPAAAPADFRVEWSIISELLSGMGRNASAA